MQILVLCHARHNTIAPILNSFCGFFFQETCTLPTSAKFVPRESFWDPIRPSDVAWNFEKFVIDKTGRPVFRFLSSVEPWDILEILKKLVDNGQMTKQELLEDSVISDKLVAIEQKY